MGQPRRKLQGPGSERRLCDLHARFRSISVDYEASRGWRRALYWIAPVAIGAAIGIGVYVLIIG